jgi:hypothetical protein
MRTAIVLVVTLFVTAIVLEQCLAERLTEKKEQATHVVSGVIKDIVAKESKFETDGIMTNYTAEIAIDTVDKGKGLKAGETVKAYWFHVTKTPSKPLPAAYGHDLKAAKKGAAVRAYLMKRKDGFEVIYNKDGLEAIKK